MTTIAVPMRPGGAPAARTATAQRADGSARVAFDARADGVTRLDDLYQRAPCRVLFPRSAAGEPPQAVLLTTTGGLTGGDRVPVRFAVGSGARATLSTQAAEKIYRALPDEAPARVDVAITVDDAAWAEWLAQETILFDGARLHRRVEADVAPGGRLLAIESAVFGRSAMGETMRRGLLHDAWRIRRGGRLVWADGQRFAETDLAPTPPAFGLDGARALATLIYVGDDAAAMRDRVRPLIADAGCDGAATCIDGVLVTRLMGAEPPVRRAVMALGAALRAAAAGLMPELPRVWHC